MSTKAKLAAKIGVAAAIAATSLVVTYEGYVPWVHRDPIGRLAACYGHDDPKLKPGTSYTKAQCVALLEEDLAKHAEALDCFKHPLTDGQKAAMVSFAFNVGVKAVCTSTLVRKANAGAEPAEWCDELNRWVFAGGQKLLGLVKRRDAEYEMCVS
jgi:lysozyme